MADLDPARAAAVAAAQPGVRALTVDELLADDQVDVVLNLTVPAAHAEVALRAIAAGKHVYGEKPLAATLAESPRGRRRGAGRPACWSGCAPDTVLGTGVQTARKAVDDGLIGAPIFATATHDHPRPRALAPGPRLLLPARRRAADGHGAVLRDHAGHAARPGGLGGRRRAAGPAASAPSPPGPRAGERVPVDVDTHVSAVLVHASGALSTLVMSFDGVATRAPNIEVHGETGSARRARPQLASTATCGCIELGGASWRTLRPRAGYEDAGRGCGLADMARTPTGQPPGPAATSRCHVLEIMESVLARGRRQRDVGRLRTTVERPAAVPLSDAPR